MSATDPIHADFGAACRPTRDVIQLDPLPGIAIDDALSLWPLPKSSSSQARGRQLIQSGNILPYFILRNRNPEPIHHILRCVRVRWGAFGIIERPYLDLEFWDAHSGFYDKCFLEHWRSCVRLHFFSLKSTAPHKLLAGSAAEAIEQKARKEMITHFKTGLSWSEIQAQVGDGLAYRGYCVLRPTMSFCVGRTAICFDERAHQELIESYGGDRVDAVRHFGLLKEEEGKPYLKASHKCTAHLLATRLTIDTVEFMQQDPNLGPCATVSMWVATHITSEKFGLNKFNYSTITRQAIGAWNRDRQSTATFEPSDLDTGGLYPSEMRNAISQTGGRGLTIWVKKRPPENESLRLQQELYSFVESGIPVILCLNDLPNGRGIGHAVVVVGHHLSSWSNLNNGVGSNSLTPANAVIPSASNHHFLLSSAVRTYYAHDDSYGPFNRITFFPDGGQEEYGRLVALQPTEPKTERRRLGGPLDSPMVRVGRDELSVKFLQGLVVPLSPLTNGDSSGPLEHVLGVFDRRFLGPITAAVSKRPPFLWRSLLMEGAEFKASTQHRYSREVISWYASMMLPRYVWLFELSVVNDHLWERQFYPHAQRDIVGEFLCDPTTPSRDPRCLSMRLLNVGYDYRDGGAKPHRFAGDSHICSSYLEEP